MPGTNTLAFLCGASVTNKKSFYGIDTMSSLGGEWRNLSLQPEDVFEADEDGRFKAEAGESLL